ncbi:ribosomal-protein-alanine N-acetyltransferase [Affinibrenneria salicis]|uniref:[Ribosomal protein bS18]-alanine N-acetyltransferase n=1 Tax=Affinibrenneria salicis TaxID=2590031 RepID=A0A5J5G5X5_9GAMM|nr:ribosomal protein S18-alanine N-acetyltransferase [Affinibrenneria salicis]KAA9002710.1 ribosomal-protein-alanine N-acetyltransferase [Affinibrenneria salicis]KAA9003003.1 ribosomal-protein-alanine N-acetyltransferase [Affinibrenneria salicis]
MKTISILTPDDLPQALRIEQASHRFPWTEKTLYSNQGERYFNLKLAVRDELAAFAITQRVLDEATLFNLAVHPSHQRKGYGRQLLEHLIAELEQRDILTLWLEVRASNQPALALYQQLGFNEVSLRRNYYPAEQGREDAVIMALPLG